jgi:hypothetical protein
MTCLISDNPGQRGARLKPLLAILGNIHINKGGCWLYGGTPRADGYICCRGFDPLDSPAERTTYAHRLIYLILCGPIPKGMTIDHKCKVRHCVNPDHLEVVTIAENRRRARKITREQIAELAAQGFGRNQIADKLGVHRNTVLNTTKRGGLTDAFPSEAQAA